MNKLFNLTIILAACFLNVKQLQAQTSSICEAESGAHCYYIAPDGNDNNTGTFEAPYASINPVVNNLQPGDFIYFRGGNYGAANRGQILDYGNNNRYVIAHLNDVDGEEGNLITLKAYPGELPVIDLYELNPEFDSTSLFGEPRDAFSIESSSYIKIEGFEIIHGSIHLWNNSHHVWIENNHVHDLYTMRDNNGLILLQFAQNVYAYNNNLHDAYERGIPDPDNPEAPCNNADHSGCILNTIKSHFDAGHNGCITTLSGDIYVGYGRETSGPFEFMSNDIHDCPVSFFIKNAQGENVDQDGFNMIIEDNYIHQNGYLFYGLHSSNTLFKNNLCRDGCRINFVGSHEYPTGEIIDPMINEIDARNIRFESNIFLDVPFLFSIRGLGFQLENGIYSTALEDKLKFENNIVFMSEASSPGIMNWNEAGFIFGTSSSGQIDLENSPIPSKILSRIISKNNCFANSRGLDIAFFKQFLVNESGSVQSIVGYDHATAISNFALEGTNDIFPVNTDLSSYFTDQVSGDFSLLSNSPCAQANVGLNNSEIIRLIINGETIVIHADVNQDSQINTTDAMLTLRNSLGLSMDETAWQASDTTGDVNCDNVSNSTDAMLILRYSLGLDMSGTGWCI